MKVAAVIYHVVWCNLFCSLVYDRLKTVGTGGSLAPLVCKHELQI